MRLKHVLAANNSGAWGSDTPAPGLHEMRVWRSTDVSLGGEWTIGSEPAVRFLSPREVLTATLREGDLLVTKASGSVTHIGKTALADASRSGDGFSNFMQRLRVRPPASSRYVWYLLNSSVARAHHDQHATTSSGLKNLNGHSLSELVVPVVAGQAGIADFLDRECERIAAASHTSAQLIETLGSQRYEVFDRLTLDQSTLPLRHRLVRIEQGWSPECEAYPADVGEWGVLKVGCVNHGRFHAEEQKRLPDDVQPRPHLEIHPGDILMSRANTRELVGSAALVEDTSGRRLMLCDILYRLVPTDDIRPRFLTRALMSRRVRSQIEAAAAGAAGSMPKISQSVIRALRVPDLALDEQRRVELIADEHAHRVTAAVKGFALLDARLTEYRDALITEGVTGQLDVMKLSESQLAESAHAAAEGERPEVLTS